MKKIVPYSQLRKRIERDKEKKRQRRAAVHERSDDFNKVYTTRHYIRSLRKCNAGVSFKQSVQKYNARAVTKINGDLHAVRSGNPQQAASSRKVVIRERGHRRVITPIVIDNRVSQHVLCDYALIPIMEQRLIYDNGASTKGKGTSFARRRFNRHLEEAKAKWGDDFYAFVFDFKGFFDSIPHAVCMNELDRAFRDKRLVGISMQVIESYQARDAETAGDNEWLKQIKNHEGRGICLGSQVSQIMALAAPNAIDHAFKDRLGVRDYKRYMDDGVMFDKSKKRLTEYREHLRRLAESVGLELNMKKTQIIHIRKGVTFLKVRYIVRGAKTIKLLARSSAVRMRRKLKKFTRLVRDGKMTMDDVFTSIQSWLAHTRAAMAFHTRRRMLALYDDLFGGYRITKKWRRRTA